MLFGFLLIDILLFVVLPIVILLLLAFDNKWWATTLLVVVGAALAWTNGFSETADALFTAEFAVKALKYGSVYALIGFGFSFLKWKIVAMKSAKEFRAFVAQHPERARAEIVDMWPKADGQRGRDGQYGVNSYGHLIKVKAGEHDRGYVTTTPKLTLTEYVTMWVIYWPFYAALLVLDDLIRHVFEWFTEVFGKVFTRMANDSFSDIK